MANEKDHSDLDLRVTALNFAQTAHQHPDGSPAYVLPDARGIYLFLKGIDPVVDGSAGTLDQSKADPNVISFGDWLREDPLNE